jgi:hypothetical protein
MAHTCKPCSKDRNWNPRGRLSVIGHRSYTARISEFYGIEGLITKCLLDSQTAWLKRLWLEVVAVGRWSESQGRLKVRHEISTLFESPGYVLIDKNGGSVRGHSEVMEEWCSLACIGGVRRCPVLKRHYPDSHPSALSLIRHVQQYYAAIILLRGRSSRPKKRSFEAPTALRVWYRTSIHPRKVRYPTRPRPP